MTRLIRSSLLEMIGALALFLCFCSSKVLVSGNEFQAIKREESASALFDPPPELRVLGPSHFPPPTLKIGKDVQILLEPVIGQHRPDQDAVIAYAEGYKLSYYMLFMETLTKTGFRGDVVLSIADDAILQPNVKEYLETFAAGDENKPSIVVYQLPLDCDGTEDHTRSVSKSGDLDIFQMCRLGSHVYGWKDELGQVTRTATDPREGRTVATIRYEWYWICSQQYHKHSWLMLIDARDSFFQSNPFVDLPRETTDPDRPDGLLYFFGENANATRLGISKKNRNWLTRGYGNEVIEILKNYPTICSGSTMGEQVAVETYLRAMVNEHDECEVRMTGSDQGFHNYLYYSQKLSQASTIRRLVVWEQGRGMINNLGALREKTLEEWGNYDPATHQVYQWDGETLSPVVHQWDRDNHLHKYLYVKEFSRYNQEWKNRKTTA